MSVVRVIFRLEISDTSTTVVDLGFQGSFVQLPQKYATVSPIHCLTPVQASVYKGKREYYPITIESYYIEEMAMSDETSPITVDSVCPVDDLSDGLSAGVHRTPADGIDAQRRLHEYTEVHSPRHRRKAIADAEAKPHGASSGPGSSPVGRSPLSTRHTETDAAALLEQEQMRPSSATGVLRSKLSTGNTVRFSSGNPMVETMEGILHLYKEDSISDPSAIHTDLLCMMAVPAEFNSQDLLQFVAPMSPWLEHIKIIRDNVPNQYMVLLKFRNAENAAEFYNTFNNQPYNSIESEICHLVYVAKVETLRSCEGAAIPLSGATELPICPVCLERMDESVDGILTILCNHSFHGDCLANWKDTSCPVCRYIQTPVAVADNKCFECSAKENLWICLICGVVGCGRYVEGHAYRHFKDTNHTYTMELGSNRVWDYAGENYVHRLVQNKGDGKLVEVDEREAGQDDKMDSLALEYTYLLTSQLESQRQYFEEKMQLIEKDANRRVEEVEVRAKKALEACARSELQLSALMKEKLTCDKRCNQLSAKLAKITSELNEEREMNQSLRSNQTVWQSRVGDMEERLNTKEKEIRDLNEQLRDVMFYLEAKQTLSTTTEATQQEIQEGQIVMELSPTASGTTGKKQRTNKKR